MATTTDSSSNHHSPGVSTDISDDHLNGPECRRSNLPWAQVVRGDSESMSAVHHSPPSSSSSQSLAVVTAAEQTPFSDCSASKAASLSQPPDNFAAAESSDANNGNAAAPPKKPAWNKPSNGVLEVRPVMDAVSWPALSESTKASPKLPADLSSKPTADGSVPIPQGLLTAPSSRKHGTSNSKSNSTSNHAMPARQRYSKRGGGGSSVGGGPARSSFTHPPPPPPPPPPFPVFQIPPNNYGSQVPVVLDPSPRDPPFRSNNWDARPVGGFVPQSRGVVDHRNSSRRGNFGPHHNTHGGRRDQDRGSYSNTRDVQMQQQRPPPRGFVRPSPPYTAPYLTPPPPIRPIGNPMVFPEFVYVPTLPEPFRGVPFMLPPPMFVPVADPPLSALIVNQIDYYFSDANLVKDDFLRSNMDDQGWVPIALIASFPRVKNLTNNIHLIVESLRVSSIVEVQDDNKVRRRNEWANWLPSSNRLGTDSGLPSPGESSHDILSASFQKITVGEASNSQNMTTEKGDPNTEGVLNRQLPNGDIHQNANSQDQ